MHVDYCMGSKINELNHCSSHLNNVQDVLIHGSFSADTKFNSSI